MPSTSRAQRGASEVAGSTRSERATPSDEPHVRPGDRAPAAVLTVGETLGLALVTTVGAIASWSLALAQVGRHDGWTAVALGAATALVIGVVAVRVGGRPIVRFDAAELGILVATVVVGSFFFVPGFDYTWDDKDPGVYVAHGIAIARDGDVFIEDEVVARGIEPAFDQAGRFPGLWVEEDHPAQVTSQFYHLYSAMLATAHDVGGSWALYNLNPLLAVASLSLIVLAVRRAASTLAAVVTGALLVTSMMQVWQAKYPSTEIPAQFLLAGLLLAAVLAIERRWAGAGLIVGILAGVGFLARPDGFLYMLFVLAGVAVAVATGRFDRRSWAVLGGLAITAPYAFWNAFVARQSYSESNSVPGAVTLLAAGALTLVAGRAARSAIRAIADRWPTVDLSRPHELSRRWHVAVGTIVSLAASVVLVLLFFRDELFGADYAYLGFTGRVERSYAEMNMMWLSWFVSVRGLVVMGIGIFVLMLGRWRAALFALVLPGALLLPLYLYDARVSMRLMWWVRRFIPAAVPAVMILIALAICWALTRRQVVVKLVGAAVALSLLVEFTQASLPLRHHDEMGGSREMAQSIAAAAGDEQGVFLFPPGSDIYSINRNAPGIVWLVFDQLAARLPETYGLDDIEQYGEAFPDQPVFLVTPDPQLPAGLPADRFTDVDTVDGTLVVWDETRDKRPDEAVETDMQVTVWQLDRR